MIFKSRKKGQAAMEFLMTYGWAILAAIVVIGALAYFGVFNTGIFVPQKCQLDNQLSCSKNFVVQESSITIGITNNNPNPVYINDVNISPGKGNTYLTESCYADLTASPTTGTCGLYDSQGNSAGTCNYDTKGVMVGSGKTLKLVFDQGSSGIYCTGKVTPYSNTKATFDITGKIRSPGSVVSQTFSGVAVQPFTKG